MVLMVPLLLVGGVLTASVYGIYFGLPLLAVTWPVFRAGRRAFRQPSDRAALRRVVILGSLAAAVLSGAVAIAAVIGRDDLDSAIDIAAFAVAGLWVAGIWNAAAGARRALLGKSAEIAPRETDPS